VCCSCFMLLAAQISSKIAAAAAVKHRRRPVNRSTAVPQHSLSQPGSWIAADSVSTNTGTEAWRIYQVNYIIERLLLPTETRIFQSYHSRSCSLSVNNAWCRSFTAVSITSIVDFNSIKALKEMLTDRIQ